MIHRDRERQQSRVLVLTLNGMVVARLEDRYAGNAARRKGVTGYRGPARCSRRRCSATRPRGDSS